MPATKLVNNGLVQAGAGAVGQPIIDATSMARRGGAESCVPRPNSRNVSGAVIEPACPSFSRARHYSTGIGVVDASVEPDVIRGGVVQHQG